MVGVQDSSLRTEETYAAPPIAGGDWSDSIEADLERAIAQRTPLQQILHNASQEEEPVRMLSNQPLREALSAIRDDLDRRTREWRGSAKVVEQTLRQLVTAEQARATALQELARIEADVARTGQALTEALSTFDETGESKNIDPRFAQSEYALQELDRVTADLAISQHCCRSAWKAYADALEREQYLRSDIQSGASNTAA